MSPTTILPPVLDGHDGCMLGGVGRGVPGVVRTGVGREGAIPVPVQDHPRDPYLVIFEARALPTAK